MFPQAALLKKLRPSHLGLEHRTGGASLICVKLAVLARDRRFAGDAIGG
jgi:hypothetical protein